MSDCYPPSTCCVTGHGCPTEPAINVAEAELLGEMGYRTAFSCETCYHGVQTGVRNYVVCTNNAPQTLQTKTKGVCDRWLSWDDAPVLPDDPPPGPSDPGSVVFTPSGTVQLWTEVYRVEVSAAIVTVRVPEGAVAVTAHSTNGHPLTITDPSGTAVLAIGEMVSRPQVVLPSGYVAVYRDMLVIFPVGSEGTVSYVSYRDNGPIELV